MNKEWLVKLGLTEEQADAVMKGLDDNFITKSRFNDVNEELKQLKLTVKERDEQLETLKKSTGDVEALNKQITELQADNKAKDEAHAAELKAAKINAALTAALTGAKAKNPETFGISTESIPQLKTNELLKSRAIVGNGIGTDYV